jgi:DNA repair protein RadD
VNAPIRPTAPVQLYPHQIAMRAEFEQHVRAGQRRLLGAAPTGSGKGTLAAALISRAVAKNKRAAFVSHLREINSDVVNRIRAAGVDRIDVAMGSHTTQTTTSTDPAAVLVCSVQTARARSIVLDHDLVIVDECHRTASASYDGVLSQCRPDAVVIGLTATPERSDGRPLGRPHGPFDVLVQGPQPGELVGLGLLAPIVVFAPAAHQTALCDDPVTRYPGDHPGLVFCASLEHSRQMAAGLAARGLRAAHADADTPNRGDLIAAFNDGRLDVLTNYRLFTEGIDLPRAEVVMLASNMTSTGGFLQAIGRARRVSPTKVHATLIDLCGLIWVHGTPDQPRTYHLDGKPIRVKDALRPCTQCRSCLAWCPPSSRCMNCGSESPPAKPPRIKRAPLEQRANDLGTDQRQAMLVRWLRDRGPRQAAAIYRRIFRQYPPAGWIETALRMHREAAGT